MRYFIDVAVALVIFSFSFTPKARAIGNIHVGILEIDPFVLVKQKYDDNIFLETDEEKNEDWTTTTTLGVQLYRPVVPLREEDFLFKAKYSTDFIQYHKYKGQSRIDQALSFSLDYKSPHNLTLQIKNDAEKTADPANTELTDPEKRFANTAEIVLGCQTEKIGFDLGYRNVRDNYKNLDNLDKYESVVTPTGFYYIFPKTQVFAEYNLGWISYDDSATNSDSKYHQWRAGIRGAITPRLTGVFKAGYKQAEYEQSGKQDFQGLTVFGDLTYTLSERTTLWLYTKRASEESTYKTASHYEVNRMELALKHQLLERLFLETGGSGQFNQYPEETTEGSQTAKRKDKLFNAKLKLSYEVKDWLFLEPEYEHTQRNSKFAKYDYKDNKFLMTISIFF